jgi:hypothetical protein
MQSSTSDAARQTRPAGKFAQVDINKDPNGEALRDALGAMRGMPPRASKPMPSDVKGVAAALVIAGLWIVVLRPDDKSPIGEKWGLHCKDFAEINELLVRHRGAGLGICLGPGRGPGGRWLVDLEIDGPQGEASLVRLLGSEAIKTMSWKSRRGNHYLFVVDGDRLLELLSACKAVEGKTPGKVGSYQLASFPDLEIRCGGHKKDGVVKQVQSVIPPTTTDGVAREWIAGPEALLELPDCVYATLEDIAEHLAVRTVDGPDETHESPGSHVWDEVVVCDSTGTAAHAWFRKGLDDEAAAVAGTPEGRRRDRLRDAAFTIGGILHHGFLDEYEAVRVLTEAGEKSGLPPDEVRKTVADGLADGKAAPLPWPNDLDMPNGQHSGSTSSTRPKTPPLDLGMIGAEAMFGPVVPPRWFVNGVIAADQPTIFGGPLKALKTSMLLDLLIALGSGTKFLGHFTVPQPVRCGMISGETGRYVLRANALEMAKTRGIDIEQNKNMFWGFTVPNLAADDHLIVVQKMVRQFKLEVLILDPFYLSLHGEDVDPKNMFSMGPALSNFGKICMDAGCLPILAHHFTKSRLDPYAPPELHELAYGGVSQWMRQWLLVTRRVAYDGGGHHEFHWRHGGSFGHSGERSLDIETGVVDENFNGRKWEVTVHSTSHLIASQEQERQAQTAERLAKKAAEKKAAEEHNDREDMATAVKIFQKQPDRRLTKTGLREKAKWDSIRAAHVLYRLLEDKFIKPCRFEVTIGSGARRMCDGYELNER